MNILTLICTDKVYATIIKIHVLLIVLIVLSGKVIAIPINISIFNESTAIPYTKVVTTPIHPGFQLGTEFNLKVKEHSRLFQTANICYFYHNYLAQGIGLYTELGYEYRLKVGFAFSGLLGIGYMHTFTTAEEFLFINEQYKKKADTGNARLFPSFSIDIGYYLRKTLQNSPKIFIRYQTWAEYPYSPDFIPVMTHINLHIGAKISIRSKPDKSD